MEAIDKTLAKYDIAKDTYPTHERVTYFSWGDMVRLKGEIERLREESAKAVDAINKAFLLGQTYWQQADSESFTQNRQADETMRKYIDLVRPFESLQEQENG